MRTLLVLLVLFLLLVPGISLAQIGVPIPTPGIIGVPVPYGPPIYSTNQWIPPAPQPTTPPTLDPRFARIEINFGCGLLYLVPALRLFLPIQSPKVGFTFDVQFIDTSWMKALNGPYENLYLERCGYRVV